MEAICGGIQGWLMEVLLVRRRMVGQILRLYRGAANSIPGNPLGLVYVLNFSTPFNTSQNISAILTTISKASGGGAANNIAPQYVDGTMFANDYEWFTYGGLLADTAAYSNPDSQSVAAYEQYPSGPPKQFSPGYILDDLPDGITRYVTYGAGVSIPSENLGFYFGGLRSASWGEIVLTPGVQNQSLNADVNSLTLIELDMSVQQQEKWTNHTLLPDVAPGRASAEIAWVPVSEQGILVAIGGVIDPAYANVNQTNNASTNAASVRSPISTRDLYSHPFSQQLAQNSCRQCLYMISPTTFGTSRQRLVIFQASWPTAVQL